MPSTTEITVSQLSRLVGIPGAPALVDVRTDEEFKADPRRLSMQAEARWPDVIKVLSQ